MKAKDKKARFERLVEMGCVVCGNSGFGWTPPEIHHLKGYEWSSMGKRAKDEHTIPLCAAHHRHGHGQEIGYHQSPSEFEDKYGSQGDLLRQVDMRINHG